MATCAFVGGSMEGEVRDFELEVNGKPASLVEVRVGGLFAGRVEQYLRSDPQGDPDFPYYVYTYFGDL